MKNNTFAKIQLYILSLWLLFALIIILTIDIPMYFGEDWVFIGLGVLIIKNIIPIICIFFLVMGFIFFKIFEYRVEGSNKLAKEILDVENGNYEHLSFLATYIIPLICFNFDDLRYIILLTIVLVIIGAIYIKTDIFYANPTLALLGYHIYKVNWMNSGPNKAIIITRDKLSDNERIKTIKLDKNIYYGRKN